MANRRFVPFYFDLSNRGFAGDPDAREFVVKQRKRLGGRSVPTPPVLFMSPDGEVLGEVSNYATEKKVLATMRKVLKQNPEFDEPGADEKAIAEKADIEKAELLIDLLDYEGAKKVLAKIPSDEAHYLLGRLARFERKWKVAEASFRKVKRKDLFDDVRMERAYCLWHDEEFEKLRDHLKEFPKQSNRYTEARYYSGLASYHLDEKDAALEVWSDTIEGCSQDPWIYRTDWAYSGAKQKKGRGFFSSAGNRTSKLNRIGYMGRRNPDLAGPR